MRKAFDANVPKLKPRLKGSSPVSTLLEASVEEAPQALRVPTGVEAPPPALVAAAEAAAARTVAAPPPPAFEAEREDPGPLTARAPLAPVAAAHPAPAPVAVKVAAALAAAPAAPAGNDDLGARRARLDKIKARVAEAARPAVKLDPAPGDPVRAAQKVLGLAHDLEVELSRAREREEALRLDLEAARAEASRASAETRAAGEKLAVAEAELVEKRTVLGDLLGELQALEAERDEALRRAQAMAAIDEERAKLLEDLSRRADDEARRRAEGEAEVARLTEDLRDAATDGARLRAALAELSRERDGLAAEVTSLKRDREELDAAKRALEQVHTALSQARARLG
jgi:hypothetical protein